MSQNFVVVGGGLAASNAVEQLRADGFDGAITLFAEEPHLPYERPPLSKGVLLGNDAPDSVFPHPAAWYDEHEVDVWTGTPVTGLDAGRHTVTTAAGEQHYDRLLLATGSTPRRLPMADESGAEAHYLRTIEDSAALRAAFAPDRRVVVVGGGWIGLEVASAARQAGSAVTVVESFELPLLRVLGPEIAKIFADLHTEHDVDLRLSATLASLEASGPQTVVRLEDGTRLEADVLVVGIGVSPNTELAEMAGLAIDNGVLVDARLTTSDSDIFAAGDIANHDHPTLGHRVRVEHWDNAIEQGKAAAKAMLGNGSGYDRLPYFFTDQYDLGMEYVGHVGPDGYDSVVVRGDTAERVFTAFWLKGDHVVAGMQVNDWDAMDGVRAIVGRRVDARSLADTHTGLADFA
jgi:3-phenylpropionate/trans-cinnamate dioxygenase ferredoxin reductase subunit